ncbi:histidine phosphatase family protein [Vagococcus sp. WN89Y]|uniref:histidine phosphatase family protein n=1 Tax=Vagococcus sp. WN89Y TaxID=3457258 RepID=UPI003FCDA7B9
MRYILAALTLLSSSAMAQALNSAKGTVDILFVRHGETIFNLYDRVQGWSDTPLTNLGIEVARAFGLRSKTIPFERYYSGDSGRQRETLALIMNEHQEKQLPIELTGLREVFFGGFEGLPNKEMNDAVSQKSGQDIAALRLAGKMPLDELVDSIHQVDKRGDAETANQVRERMQQALHYITQDALRHRASKVLVVSSGMSIGVMISNMTNDPAKKTGPGNAAAVRITWHDGRYQVNEIGDMQYVNMGKKLLASQQEK